MREMAEHEEPALAVEAAVSRRVDAGEVTLAWGVPARWKAVLRDESLRAHLELPVGERLRAALLLVQPRKDL